jgi:hypothetical protein
MLWRMLLLTCTHLERFCTALAGQQARVAFFWLAEQLVAEADLGEALMWASN